MDLWIFFSYKFPTLIFSKIKSNKYKILKYKKEKKMSYLSPILPNERRRYHKLYNVYYYNIEL